MILSYLLDVDKSKDLRKILSQNIRNARSSLHITQAKLAEYADISVPHMLDIEYCKTWVSDKTLQNLAKALNKEAWELLSPGVVDLPKGRKVAAVKQEEMQRIADLVVTKKEILRRAADEAMEDLVMEIIRGD